MTDDPTNVLLNSLEPNASLSGACGTTLGVFSIAISLRRIADSLTSNNRASADARVASAYENAAQIADAQIEHWLRTPAARDACMQIANNIRARAAREY